MKNETSTDRYALYALEDLFYELEAAEDEGKATKAEAIRRLSELLLENHGGAVPQTFAELEALPGVGHKTASVVMAQAFGVPAFPVDTHIHRLAQRWKLTPLGTNVERTERDLKRLFPETHWNALHLRIIFYGREHCTARGCDGTTPAWGSQHWRRARWCRGA